MQKEYMGKQQMHKEQV